MNPDSEGCLKGATVAPVSIWSTVLSIDIPARDNFGEPEPGPPTTIDVATTRGYGCDVRLSLYSEGGESESVYLTLSELGPLAAVLGRLVDP